MTFWRRAVTLIVWVSLAALVRGASPVVAAVATVDVTSMRLAYVTASRPDHAGQFGLLYNSPVGTTPLSSDVAGDVMRLSEDAFFLGLTVPDAAVWVNLTPDQPGGVCDRRLSKTGLGRALVEADFQLKRDGCALTDPRTSALGQAFWERVRRVAAGGALRAGARMWIVPGPMELSGDDQGVYLRSMRLLVRLETERFSSANSPYGMSEIDRISRELVLPVIEQRVNEDRIYAPLRQVYAAIVLARWYKKHVRGTDLPHAKLVDASNTAGHELTDGWTPRTVWEAYVRSYQQGEYDFTERSEQKMGNVTRVSTRRYFRGGVDLRTLPLPTPTPLAPQQSAAIQSAFSSGVAVTPDGMLLFAAPTPAPTVSSTPSP
jgi:hypothetical protein